MCTCVVCLYTLVLSMQLCAFKYYFIDYAGVCCQHFRLLHWVGSVIHYVYCTVSSLLVCASVAFAVAGAAWMLQARRGWLFWDLAVLGRCPLAWVCPHGRVGSRGRSHLAPD